MKRTGRRAAVAVLALALAGAGSVGGATVAQAQQAVAAAAAPSLFAPAAAGDLQVSADAPARPEVMRSQYLKVNTGLLVRAAGAQADRQSLPEVSLNLFANASFTGVVTDARQDQWGSTWSGTLKDVPNGSFYLTVVDGVFMAHVASTRGVYEVTQVSGDVYRAVQIDQSKFKDHNDKWAPPAVGAPVKAAPVAAATSAADSGSTIDIMVAYTASARAAAGSTAAIKATILTALNETNAGYANSGVTPRLRLVHVEEVAYTESGNISTDVNRLAATADGFMDNLHTLRNTYGADLVGLIVENGGGYCGMAKAIMATAATAFQVTARSCATGYYSFAHEFGHLQGARHDTYVDSGTTPYAYGHGHVNTSSDATKRWRTIMSYNDRCSTLGYNCTRLQYWSNPTKTYLANAMGVLNTSENYKVLNNTAYTVANFRTAVLANDFTDDFGATAGNWSAVSGVWARDGLGQYVTNGLANSWASAKNSGKFGDVTFQAKMTRTGGPANLANRIIIRGNPASLTGGVWNPSYAFQYANNGAYSVYKMSGGVSTALKTWTASSAVLTGGVANTLKVVAVGSSLKFYINGTLVWSGTDSTLQVGQVGVGYYRDATAATLKVDSASASNTPTADRMATADVVVSGTPLSGGTIDRAPLIAR